MKNLAITNTLEVNLRERKGTPTRSHLYITENDIRILRYVFEFGLATGTHISRFLKATEDDNYLRRRLRDLWHHGYLESFKVYAGSISGMPVYYILGKEGASFLLEEGIYPYQDIKGSGYTRKLLSMGGFRHESRIIDLASWEAMNVKDDLEIKFKGEKGVSKFERIAEKVVEILTPDYGTVYIKPGNLPIEILTEYERSYKSNRVKVEKVKRYLDYKRNYKDFDPTIRFIFLNEGIELSFWDAVMKNYPNAFGTLRFLSTNLSHIKDNSSFTAPIYLELSNIKLAKGRRLKDLQGKLERTKLLKFM